MILEGRKGKEEGKGERSVLQLLRMMDEGQYFLCTGGEALNVVHHVDLDI